MKVSAMQGHADIVIPAILGYPLAFQGHFQIRKSHRLERDCESAHYFCTSTVKSFKLRLLTLNNTGTAIDGHLYFVLVLSLH